MDPIQRSVSLGKDKQTAVQSFTKGNEVLDTYHNANLSQPIYKGKKPKTDRSKKEHTSLRYRDLERADHSSVTT